MIPLYTSIIPARANHPLTSKGIGYAEEWSRVWGRNDTDLCRGIALDNDTNIYLVGNSYQNDSSVCNVTLIKYDPDGIELWNRSWGGLDDDFAHAVTVDPADDVYITGRSISYGSVGFLAKYNPDGDLLWNRTEGGWIQAITIPSIDEIYVSGSHSFGAFVAKFNSSGHRQWITFWNSTMGASGEGVAVDPSNNIYLAGDFANSTNGKDIFLAKYNSTGALNWSTYWHNSTTDMAVGIALDGANNCYLAGYEHTGPIGNALLLKYDPLGNQCWNRTWRAPTADRGAAIAVDGDSIYMVGGKQDLGILMDDAFLVEYNPSGELQGAMTWGLPHPYPDEADGIAIDKDHNIYFAGYTWANGTLPDIFLVKLTPSEEGPDEGIPSFQLLDVIMILTIIIGGLYLWQKAAGFSKYAMGKLSKG